MSISSKLGIETDYDGDCALCGRKNAIVKRWGPKGDDGRRKFVCAECAGKDDQIFKVMTAALLGGEPPP